MSVFAKKRQLFKPVSIARSKLIWLTTAVWIAICGTVFAFSLGRDFERPKALCLSLATAMLMPRALSIWPTWPKQVRSAVLIWLFVLAATVIFALDPARALIGSYERSQGALILVCCTIIAMARVPVAIIIPPVTVAVSMSGFWAIAQYLGWEPVIFSMFGALEPGASESGWHRAFDWRAFASFGNPMALGNWLVIAWVFLFVARVKAIPSLFGARALECGLIFGAVGLLLSGTRAAWIALFVVALLQLRHNKVFRIIGLVGLVACVVVLLNFRTDSVRARVELVAAALSPAKTTLVDGLGHRDRFPATRPWLGYGPDLQVALLEHNLPNRAVGAMTDRAHQMLLDSYLSIGLLGVLSGLVLMYMLWRSRIDTNNVAVFALIAALIAWQFGFALSAEKAICALLLGSMFAPKPQLDTSVVVAPARTGGALSYLSAVLFALFSMLSYLPQSVLTLDSFAPWRRPERAIVHFECAQRAIMADQGELAERELEQAVALDPWRADLARAKVTLAIELGHNAP